MVVTVMLLITVLPALSSAEELQAGKVLVAVYAAGGSLETDYGLIADDISQMVTGAANTTPETLELLVAYGGSQKPGWEGMTIMNRSGLALDLADGELGNRSYAIASYPQANMGNGSSLGTFLTAIRSGYQYDRVFLILIGHGEAYTGMLFDQNHDEDPLSIAEMVDGLEDGGFNVEVIGLDTCLMGTLEVVSQLSGYTRYLIASEESEPAEGWRYDSFISYLASHPDAPIVDLGNSLLKTYFENPALGKTLSVLDLDEAGVVTSSLEKLSKLTTTLLDTPEGYNSLTDAFHTTQQFGLTSDGVLDPATMDLIGFAEAISSREPDLADSATELINASEKMILLSGHDARVPGARGIAILSPVQINSGFYRYYHDEAFITPSWDRFLVRYLDINDHQATMIPFEKNST
ncbi:MAG: clostripain-related cysteine peptidase [Methanospirillum sp.]|uniref:clostripain-related cysteine peptidase n=1 Tax=Methanospirillum sp. TaxID=45200 RepID=UPI00236D23DC|nr:clostripain-related cysteine peptidase [Methanospirillum sp.]MDD1728974.1 clostripain-related cysteine peptidase [Methanospirillum sp.]